MLHGVAMGVASSIAVAGERLDRMARLVDAVRPLAWSEHLAFVRAGRNRESATWPRRRAPAATVEGTLANLGRALRIVGCLPAVENIATLIDPPASTMDEGEWTRAIVAATGAPMLLDLHKPLRERVELRHRARRLARGDAARPRRRWFISPEGAGSAREMQRRLLDDHVHDPPDPVYALLETLAAHAPRALTVINRARRPLSVDGRAARPGGRAREALRLGRAQRASGEEGRVSAAAVETLLARLYADADFRRDFLRDPKGVSRTRASMPPRARRWRLYDRTGLEMAAESYRRKRLGR
jgi:uncharacterized protein (UPF0276 family)